MTQEQLQRANLIDRQLRTIERARKGKISTVMKYHGDEYDFGHDLVEIMGKEFYQRVTTEATEKFVARIQERERELRKELEEM